MKTLLIILLTVLLCVLGTGCDEDQASKAPAQAPMFEYKSDISFELPKEWKTPWKSAYNNGLSMWSSYIPDSPEGVGPGEVDLDESEQLHEWKFTMMELEGDSIVAGKTPQEKAESYYNQNLEECTTFFECEVNPIRQVDYSGITTFIVEDNNNQGTVFDFWSTTAFLEKDGLQFELGVRGKFDDETTQKTIKKVIETLTIN